MTMKDDAPLRELRRSDTYALLIGDMLVAGTVQHPDTRLWQTWLIVDGQSLVNISAHKSRSDAENVVLALGETYRSEDLLDTNSAEAMIDGLNEQGDEQPTPLPPAVCEEIEQIIAREQGS